MPLFCFLEREKEVCFFLLCSFFWLGSACCRSVEGQESSWESWYYASGYFNIYGDASVFNTRF